MARKKLKIAMLNEADFMVKSRFESWNLKYLDTDKMRGKSI